MDTHVMHNAVRKPPAGTGRPLSMSERRDAAALFKHGKPSSSTARSARKRWPGAGASMSP